MTYSAQHTKNKAGAAKRTAGAIENIASSNGAEFSTKDLATLEAARAILVRYGNRLGQEAKEKLTKEQTELRRREAREREALELLQDFPHATMLEKVAFIVGADPHELKWLAQAAQEKTFFGGNPKTSADWNRQFDRYFVDAQHDVARGVSLKDKPVRELVDAAGVRLIEIAARADVRELAAVWEALTMKTKEVE